MAHPLLVNLLQLTLELAALPLQPAVIQVLFLAALQLFLLKVAEGAALEEVKPLLAEALVAVVAGKGGQVVLVNFRGLGHRVKEILVVVIGRNPVLGHAAEAVVQERLV